MGGMAIAADRHARRREGMATRTAVAMPPKLYHYPPLICNGFTPGLIVWHFDAHGSSDVADCLDAGGDNVARQRMGCARSFAARARFGSSSLPGNPFPSAQEERQIQTTPDCP